MNWLIINTLKEQGAETQGPEESDTDDKKENHSTELKSIGFRSARIMEGAMRRQVGYEESISEKSMVGVVRLLPLSYNWARIPSSAEE